MIKLFSYYIYGLTLEGFYTRLEDAFIKIPIGEDEFGEVFVKKKWRWAAVKEFLWILELNYDQKFQVESGFTIQRSLYDSEISYSDELISTKSF